MGKNEVSHVEQIKQVNVVSIADKKDAQSFEFPCQEASKHQEIATTDHEIRGEV